MKLINSAAVLLLLWPGFDYVNAACTECPKTWCPEVKNPDNNKYLVPPVMDPELSEVLQNISDRNQKSCPQVWCSAVQIPCLNQWINESLKDPDLIPTTTATTEGDETTAATSAPEGPKEDPRYSHARYVEGAGWDVGCRDATGKNFQNGMGCVYMYGGVKTDSYGKKTRICSRGSCQNGRCVLIGAVTCAVY